MGKKNESPDHVQLIVAARLGFMEFEESAQSSMVFSGQIAISIPQLGEVAHVETQLPHWNTCAHLYNAS